MTQDSFKAWKAEFDKAQAVIKAREDEEKMRGMTPKEREEYKRQATRPTGTRAIVGHWWPGYLLGGV